MSLAGTSDGDTGRGSGGGCRVVCHRAGTLHLVKAAPQQWLEQDGSMHPSHGIFQTQVVQGGYLGLLSGAVIKHQLNATRGGRAYFI